MAIPAYYSLLQRGSSGPDTALVQTWLNGVRDACTWYSLSLIHISEPTRH